MTRSACSFSSGLSRGKLVSHWSGPKLRYSVLTGREESCCLCRGIYPGDALFPTLSVPVDTATDHDDIEGFIFGFSWRNALQYQSRLAEFPTPL